MTAPRIGWALEAVALSASLVILYPQHGVLLDALFGVAIAGMLATASRGTEGRAVRRSALVAATTGPVLSLAVTGELMTRAALELSIGPLTLVAAIGLHRHISRLPSARPTVSGATGHA